MSVRYFWVPRLRGSGLFETLTPLLAFGLKPSNQFVRPLAIGRATLVMAEIEIRVATAEDAVAIGAAHGEAWRVAYADLFPAKFLELAVAERLERWPRLYAAGAEPDFLTCVPVLDGRVVGFSTVRPAAAADSMGEVLGFYLHPDAWGSGAAWELMQHALDGFRHEGYDSAHLWAHPGAKRAHAFYLKAGFELTGRAQSGAMIDGYDPVPTVEFRRDL